MAQSPFDNQCFAITQVTQLTTPSKVNEIKEFMKNCLITESLLQDTNDLWNHNAPDSAPFGFF